MQKHDSQRMLLDQRTMTSSRSLLFEKGSLILDVVTSRS